MLFNLLASSLSFCSPFSYIVNHFQTSATVAPAAHSVGGRALCVSLLACVCLAFSPLCLSSNYGDANVSGNPQGVAYSLGASMGAFLGLRARASVSLGINIADTELIAGFADGVDQSSKLTVSESQDLLKDYDKAKKWLSSTVTDSAKHSLTEQQSLHLTGAGYALGVAKGEFLREQLLSHSKLGFKFDASELIAGFKDALNDELTLSQTEMTDLLTKFDIWVKNREHERTDAYAVQRIADGEVFIDKFRHKAGVLTTPDGVSYLVLSPVIDNKVKPSMGDTVVVNYRGKLIDGSEFVSGSKTHMEIAEVISGLADGLQQMVVGSKIRLVIPAISGFGNVDIEFVPSNSVLIFDVELLSIISEKNKTSSISTYASDSIE